MKLLSFVAYSDNSIKPVYCNKLVKSVLPFEHGRVTIVEGKTFSAEVKDGRTILTVKPEAGASEAPEFKCPYPTKVKEAIQALRMAATARVHQMIADGETVCLS
jgi:hypothetical protein